jgi:hypothetical protein
VAEGIRFIRKHGRIIPIHDRNGNIRAKRSSDVKKGSAAIGGAAAVTAGAATASALIDRKEAKIFNESVTHGKIYAAKKAAIAIEEAHNTLFVSPLRRSAAQHLNLARKNIKISRALSANSRAIQRGGKVAAASLVAYGTDKLLPDKAKKNSVVRGAVAVGTGVGTLFALETVYNRIMQPKVTNASGKAVSATWHAIKTAALVVGSKRFKV